VLSLLTKDEERDLELENEAAVARNRGIEFLSLPVPGRGIPSSESDFTHAVDRLDSTLDSSRPLPAWHRTQRNGSGMRPRSEWLGARHGHRAREFGARHPDSRDPPSARMDRTIRFTCDARSREVTLAVDC
jgi:hypothetical protein